MYVNGYLLKNNLIPHYIELYFFKICVSLRNIVWDVHRNVLAKLMDLPLNKKHIRADCMLIRFQLWVDTKPSFGGAKVSFYGWLGLLLFCIYKFTMFLKCASCFFSLNSA